MRNNLDQRKEKSHGQRFSNGSKDDPSTTDKKPAS